MVLGLQAQSVFEVGESSKKTLPGGAQVTNSTEMSSDPNPNLDPSLVVSKESQTQLDKSEFSDFESCAHGEMIDGLEKG